MPGVRDRVTPTYEYNWLDFQLLIRPNPLHQDFTGLNIPPHDGSPHYLESEYVETIDKYAGQKPWILIKARGLPTQPYQPWGVYTGAAASCRGKVIYWDGAAVAGHNPQHVSAVPYTPASNRERRRLAETALAAIVLHNPQLVQPALYRVSKQMTIYWLNRREQLTAGANKAQAVFQQPTRALVAPRKPVVNAQNQIQYLQPKPLKIGHHHTAPQGVSALQVANNAVPPDSWSAVRATAQYTHGETSFGRLGAGFPPELAMAVQQMLSALHGNSIPKILNVHDNFLRIFQMLGPSDSANSDNSNVKSWLPYTRCPDNADANRRKEFTATQEHWTATSFSWRRFQGLKRLLRPDEIFGESASAKRYRGRTSKENKDIKENTYPGLLSAQHLATDSEIGACWERIKRDWFDGRTLPVENEPRKRGIEKFEGTFDQFSPFYANMNAQNLFCSAGLSGSTSTLLLAATFFGDVDNYEDLKTYLLAIIGYLVGGGMHSCHEVFETAKLVGVPYTVGKYKSSLPKILTDHKLYQRWEAEFCDVVL